MSAEHLNVVHEFFKLVRTYLARYRYKQKHYRGWGGVSTVELSRFEARQQAARYERSKDEPEVLAELLPIRALELPVPISPPMYPALAEHGRLRPALALPPPPIDYSAYTDHTVTAPALLGLTDEGPIPVARIGTWRPAGVGEDGQPETPGQLTPQLRQAGELVAS